MTKEIIVNAGEAESRVAILENGRLMELHIEREPKIVGNIYRGRVTKVLKGMDAAFIDIGIERNAFLSAADIVPEDGEEDGHGRLSRNIPPITQLLRAGQELLVQVARAPMGTKGARITTRLSLPGRYMVLMLNSGSYIGVSRKISDPRERQRLRALATRLRPDTYSLIVRTEAEGKSDEELEQDLTFLLDMARRIEQKAAHAPVPSLVHGDLTLIFRLIRDAFTRDVNRLLVDSPSTYENVLELVGMIAPKLKNRVFLYDETAPIFHAYNIEPEIERMLRRRVWLPSGGSLVVDQAEALTAIDVNTGRFVGSVELAETVLTTNLQAAEEVARQLRLRDLGGIIVVDFIDMDNPRHRQQVTKAFEDALRRDRAKIKVHSISPLGLVEMTRKRTSESLTALLTEPCPYCSGIGRVQNPLTMALRIERELAATAVEHPRTEAYLVTAHPRVIASMLGFEGEAHHDLEQYLRRPVYLRARDDFHPNSYALERLTLEQALAAVRHLEVGEMVEGQVVNPDPEVSLSALLVADGIYIQVPDLDVPVGARVKVRIADNSTSFAVGEVTPEHRTLRVDTQLPVATRPELVPCELLPPYLREERLLVPPRAVTLLSPTAEAVPEVEGEERSERGEEAAPSSDLLGAGARTRKRGRRRRRGERAWDGESPAETTPVHEATIAPAETAPIEDVAVEDTPAEVAEATEEGVTPSGATRSRRRRRRRGGRRNHHRADEAVAAEPAPVEDEVAVAPADTPSVVEPTAPEEGAERAKRPRRRPSRRKETAAEAVSAEPVVEAPPIETAPEPIASAEEPAAAPKRARRSRRATTVDTPPTTADAAPTEVIEVTAPEVEVPATRTRTRPSRRRATRRTTADEAAEGEESAGE